MGGEQRSILREHLGQMEIELALRQGRFDMIKEVGNRLDTMPLQEFSDFVGHETLRHHAAVDRDKFLIEGLREKVRKMEPASKKDGE